jgi:hypothetical protein
MAITINGTTGIVYPDGSTQNVAVGGSFVTLSGTTTLYVNTAYSYTITNYNVFSTYSVSASAGTATVSGNTISFTAPISAQTVTLTVTKDSLNSTFSLVIQGAGVATPTNSTPANGATNQTSSVALAASAFSWIGVSDTHLNSDWQLATDSGFTTVVQSTSTDATNKTTWTVTGLTVNTTYYWRVRYRGTANGVSSWSTGTTFATAVSFGPTTIGQAFGGGFYAVKIWVGGVL